MWDFVIGAVDVVEVVVHGVIILDWDDGGGGDNAILQTKISAHALAATWKGATTAAAKPCSAAGMQLYTASTLLPGLNISSAEFSRGLPYPVGLVGRHTTVTDGELRDYQMAQGTLQTTAPRINYHWQTRPSLGR